MVDGVDRYLMMDTRHTSSSIDTVIAPRKLLGYTQCGAIFRSFDGEVFQIKTRMSWYHGAETTTDDLNIKIESASQKHLLLLMSSAIC